MRATSSFIIVVWLLLCNNLFGIAQSSYTSNPGRGFMSNDVAALQILTGKQNVVPTMRFMTTYLNAFLTDNCLNDDGSIIDSALYTAIKTYYDAKLDFNGNIRYILCVFPTCTSSGFGFPPHLVEDNYTDDGKMFIWYPPKLHKILMSSSYPTKTYRTKKDIFHDTKNLSIIDFRSDIVYEVYRHVLMSFSDYLNEKLERLDIYGNPLKRGDFIACIEMAFLGPYGEGWNTFYTDYENSEPFVRIAELYKEFLGDYILVAPSFGMRNTTTTNPNLKDYQYYLMTTTYGNGKEFGLFMDHLGTNDYLNDFIIDYEGVDFKQLAKDKYKKAIFIGENSGGFQKEAGLIIQCIHEYKVSMCTPRGALELNEDAKEKWWEASKMMGYAFHIDESYCTIKRRKLSAEINIHNVGVAYCYFDYWRPQIVVKNAETGEEIVLVDISNLLDLSQPQSNFHVEINRNIIPRKVYRQNPNASYNCYLRVVDKKGISNPLEFENYEEDEVQL